MKPKILMLEDMCKEGRDILSSVFDLEYTDTGERYNGVFVKLAPVEIEDADFIACPCTGTDHIKMINEIPIVNLSDPTWLFENIYATAEHTIGLMLALIRKICAANRHIIYGNYYRDLFIGTELRGKTLGIIGYGRVGKQVAKIAKAFGMNVLKYDIKYGNASDLTDVLSKSDIVSIHVSLTCLSVFMIDYNALKHIKNGAYIINTARSLVVHPIDLLDYLQNGKLGGAALDVIESYTNAEKLLLRRYAKNYDNLILTPHIGGNTIESRIKTDIYIAKKIKEFWRLRKR